ncbi:UNVERIFIED_CONTAM: hypothetical protein Sradi_7109300 [Sesamum radiatum]|uniref:Reverse transcriptase domain-containing protein n=1 Tax=Sesamum radiatum TaxID=300843 RepID=A0AAW2J2X8_SESRA
MQTGYANGLRHHMSVCYLVHQTTLRLSSLGKSGGQRGECSGLITSWLGCLVFEALCEMFGGIRFMGRVCMGLVCKLKALKGPLRALRKAKGDLSDNVRLAKEFLDKAQGLFERFRDDTLFHLVHWCRVIYCKSRGGDTHAPPASQDELNLLGGVRQRRQLNLEFLQPHLKHRLTDDEANALLVPVSQEEIRAAVFDIAEDSAPGPDGYTSGFFKAAWAEVGNDVSAAVAEFFASGLLLKQLNATLLVLIPKIQLPVRVADYGLLPVAIILHFPPRFISWVEQCITTVAFSISLNGSLHGFFPGTRGIRQGDPLSPYLFVIVMEIWRILLKIRTQNADSFQYHWKCHELGILNLCFADDVLIFCAGTINSVRTIKETLLEFAEISGLRVNPGKSSIILSKSVCRDRQGILDLMGFQEGSLPIRYLGSPLTSSRLTVADCQPLIDKLADRLTGWNHLNLSLAGRAQLLKSVLSSLHLYWASIFVLPKSIIKVIEGKMRAFLWKGSSNSGYAKVSWVQVCRPVAEGGLGIRSVLFMNQALMLQHVWRILQQDTCSLGVLGVAHKLRNTHPWAASLASASWCWKKIVKISSLLLLALNINLASGTMAMAIGVALDIQEIMAELPAIGLQQSDIIRWKSGFGLTELVLGVLCGGLHLETHSHLYFNCSFSKRCLEVLKRDVRFQWLQSDWAEGLVWASRRWREDIY